MAEHILYRFYDDAGQLLYVGMSTNILLRINTHRRNSHWWSDAVEMKMQRFANSEELAEAEIIAIRHEEPLHNTIWTDHPPPQVGVTHRPKGEGSVCQRKSDGLWIASLEATPSSEGKRRRRYFYSKTREGALAKMEAAKADHVKFDVYRSGT